MTSFYFGVATFVLATVAVGLLRILHGPAAADRMMAAQLLGTGGAAVLLLLSRAVASPPIVDAALMLGLLAAFTSVAFVRGASADVEKPGEAPR